MERSPNPESIRTIHSWFIVESTPEGEAPVEIKEQWIGVALPVREGAPISTDRAVGVVSGQSYMVHNAIPVRTKEAIMALRAAGKEEAAAWWEDHGYAHGLPVLLFGGNEGTLTSPDEIDSSLVEPFFELFAQDENPPAYPPA